VKEKKKKQTEKGSVTIDRTEKMMTAEDIKEITTDIAVKMAEIKRKNRRNERNSATNQQRIKMQRRRWWYAVSGATQHMTDNRAFLTNYAPTGSEKWSVSGIGESSLTVAGEEDVSLYATVNRKRLYGTMRGVLYVPGLGINLYSIGTATDAGLKVVFANDTVSFSQDGLVIIEGERAGKKTLYHLTSKQKKINRQWKEHCLLLNLSRFRYGINGSAT
jgi:uncharacterized protein YcfL